jgi:hypothetical protein
LPRKKSLALEISISLTFNKEIMPLEALHLNLLFMTKWYHSKLSFINFIINVEETIKKIEELRQKSQEGGGSTRIEKHHSHGRITARERISLLLDEGNILFRDNLSLLSND